MAGLIIRSGRIWLGAGTDVLPPVSVTCQAGIRRSGEGQHETLARELEKELGITPTQWTFVETLHIPSEQLTVQLYLVTAWRGTPANRQAEEHWDIGWFRWLESEDRVLQTQAIPCSLNDTLILVRHSQSGQQRFAEESFSLRSKGDFHIMASNAIIMLTLLDVFPPRKRRHLEIK